VPPDDDEAKRFFIAHSSVQKEFALALREALADDAWVDLHEIDVGDILLDEIAAGIEAASDFVLLWTRESSRSAWVKYESHMAFIRYLEDAAINIRVVCLDATPVPLQFRPLLQARGLRDPSDIAAVLLGAPPIRRTLRRFVNRTSEIGALEELLYSSDLGLMWYSGVAGVGKRALAREALRRLIADASRTARVSVRRGTGFVELHLAMSHALRMELPADALIEREAREAARELLTAFASEGGVWLFEEAQHWLDVDARPNSVLDELLRGLTAAGVTRAELGAIFTSTRRPTLDPADADISDLRRVRGLRSDFALAVLRGQGAQGSDAALRSAAAHLDGHPLALEMSVGALADGSLDWEAQRISTARTVLGELRLNDATDSLLEALAALDGPLPGEQLADHLSLSAEEFVDAVGEASSYALVEERGGYLQIHPLIRDFYVRGLRRRPDYRARIGDLATRSRTLLDTTSARSAIHVDSLLTTFRLLSWSGRLGEALALHGTLFATLLETAIDLYNERRYPEALHYFEAVIESTEDDEPARLYAARTLAYLGRAGEAREMADALLEARPGDVELLRIRGRIEFILRNWAAARDFYERARGRRPNSEAVLRDLGQVNIRLQRWDAAREALERAIALREPSAFVRSYYSQVLEHFGELQRARSMIEDAIRVDPENPGFHHRLGRIALRQHDVDTAKSELRRALELNPDFHEAGVSLASLLADEGDSDEAMQLLDRVERMPAVRPSLLATIKAKVELAEGNCDRAQELVRVALSHDREPESLLLAVRVAVQCFHRGRDSPEHVRAAVEPILDELAELGLEHEAEEWKAKLDATLDTT
jgi:tetratricopeptide (TPR) repeat protein